MNGMILYYGQSSVRQFAARLNQSCGFDLVNLSLLPRLDFKDVNPLVLGSDVTRGRLSIRHWLEAHWSELRAKKLVLYIVSDQQGAALEKIIKASLTPEMRLRIQIFCYQPLLQPVDRDEQDEQLKPLFQYLYQLTRYQSQATALRQRSGKYSGFVSALMT